MSFDDNKSSDEEEVGDSWEDEDAFEDEEEGESDDESKDKDADGEKDDAEKDSKKDKKEDKGKKSSDSAIIQKQKYRDKVRKLEKDLKELREKPLANDEDKKERDARAYLAKTIKDVLKEMNSEEEERKEAEQEAFDEELDEILESTTDFTEKEIRDLCEELGVSPKRALVVLNREAKLKGKEKPKVPQPKRGSASVKDKEVPKAKGLDAVNKSLKELIRSGKL